MIVKENFEIKNLTTYKIGGKVKKVFFPETQSEFTEVLREHPDAYILGSCSNILFSSNGYDGEIIVTSELKQFELRGTHVFAAAGVKGPLLAQKTAEAGLSGFEFMIGFPGSIGGDVCMNAGAHGQNISNTLVRVCLFDKETGEVVYKTKEEMEFSYRHSLLISGRYVLLHAEFELKKGTQDEIKSLIERNLMFTAFLRIRKMILPVVYLIKQVLSLLIYPEQKFGKITQTL